jgi:nitroreductase
MEVFDAIQRRHSYRGPFTNTPVSKDDLRQIVQAGIQAPSGRNQQTTQFVILDDAETIEEIGRLNPTNEAMKSAKAYIVCIIDKEPPSVYEGLSFQIEDCAAAVENMLLAITSLGYATVWIDGWLRVQQRAEKIAELIGLPQSKMVRIILPIGVPAEQWEQKEKKSFEERAWFNKYGG